MQFSPVAKRNTISLDQKSYKKQRTHRADNRSVGQPTLGCRKIRKDKVNSGREGIVTETASFCFLLVCFASL